MISPLGCLLIPIDCFGQIFWCPQTGAIYAGLGIIWTPQDVIMQEIADGKLLPILADWDMSYEGYHLYYPNRRQNSPLFRALVEALRA